MSKLKKLKSLYILGKKNSNNNKNSKYTTIIVESQNETQITRKFKRFKNIYDMTPFWSKTDAQVLAYMPAHMRECVHSDAGVRVISIFNKR